MADVIVEPAAFVPPSVAPRGWLANVDPRLKLGGLLWVSTLSVVLDRPLALATLTLLAAVMLSGARLAGRRWLWIGVAVGLTVWGTMLSQAMFYAAEPRTPLLTLVPAFDAAGWSFDGIRFYREGLAYGLAQSLRLLSVSMAGIAFSASTSPERMLVAFRRAGLPMALAFVTVTALRFLPTLADETALVRQARGLRLRAKGKTRSRLAVFEAGSLLLPVMMALVRRATTLAVSVTARGFDPMATRTDYPPLHASFKERLVGGVLVACWGAIIIAKSLYWLYLADVFYRPGLRPMYEWVRQWL